MGEEHALPSGRKRELVCIWEPEVSGFLCGEHVDATLTEGRGQRHIHVFIEVETDRHRSRVPRTYSSRFASMSASMSAWWS